MDCPYCGADNRDRAKFCRLCAKRIGSKQSDEAKPVKGDNRTAPVLTRTRNIGLAVTLCLITIAVGSWFLLNRPENIAATPSRAVATVATPPASNPLPTPLAEAPAPAVLLSSAPPASMPEPVDLSKPVLSSPEARMPSKEVVAPQIQGRSEHVVQKSRMERKPKVVEAKQPAIKYEAAVGSQPSELEPTAPKEEPKTGMAAEMEACGGKSFIARSFCENQVRFKYCQNKWGTIPECPKQRDVSDGG